MTSVKYILSQYDIKYNKYAKIYKGYSSEKWLIFYLNEKKYILKQITTNDIERINSILSIQDSMKKYSPQVLKTKNNSLYSEYDNKFYYLCEYIESKKWKVEDNAKNIGQFLGTLHQEMAKIRKIDTKFLKIEHNILDLESLLKYHQIHKHDFYVEILKYKLDILNNLKLKDLNINLLSKQIIHGDFYFDNILFTGINFKIIDYDQSCLFYKEYEFMRGMMMMCYKIKSITKRLDFIKKFVKGYKMQNHIKSPENTYFLYLYIQANSLSSLKQHDFENNLKKSFAKKRYEILKFLYDYKDDIIAILSN